MKAYAALAGAALAAVFAAPLARAQPSSPQTPVPAVGWRAGDPGDPHPVLGPPPSAGDAMWTADGEVFRQTRALQGTSRWDLAVADAQFKGDAELKDFSCAIGLDLNGRDDADLLRLTDGAARVSTAFAARAKDDYDRPRPYHGSGFAPCTGGDHETSYPSGHATAAWTYGLILSELAPDRASAIMGRARAYGESRVICGMHWASDVDAGRRAADEAVAFMHADKGFRDEMDAARLRLAHRRSTGAAPEPGRCSVEADAVAHRPW